MLHVSRDTAHDTKSWAQQPVVHTGGNGPLIEAALRAAADNRRKARKEACLGEFFFATLHEKVSLTYEQDAEAMAEHGNPIHFSRDRYVEIANAYLRLQQTHVGMDQTLYAEAS
jgi:hypothetical protein